MNSRITAWTLAAQRERARPNHDPSRPPASFRAVAGGKEHCRLSVALIHGLQIALAITVILGEKRPRKREAAASGIASESVMASPKKLNAVTACLDLQE